MPSTYTNLNTHVVFATKGRALLIPPDGKDELHAYIGGIVRYLGGVAFAVGGTQDHVHMIIGLKPIHAPAEVLREVKESFSL